MLAVVVDDDEPVLSALQRMLGMAAPEWDYRFCQTAHEALDILASTPVDVLVTDMRMPGFDGGELLRQAAARQPSTMRVVLSGQPHPTAHDAEPFLAHHYLAKPVGLRSLSRALEVSAHAQALVQDPVRRNALGAPAAWSMPQAQWDEMQALSAEAKPDRAQVARLAARTPSLAMRLAHLAWNAFYGDKCASLALEDVCAALPFSALKAVCTGHPFLTAVDQGLEPPVVPPPNAAQDAGWTRQLTGHAATRAQNALERRYELALHGFPEETWAQ